VKTPFGDAAAFEAEGGGYFILPRHGPRHSVPPHRINYRANIAALAKLGVGDVIATSAVGSMKREFGVGELGLVDQFLDFTKDRSATFFDDRAVHTDMSAPYSSTLNDALVRAAGRLGVRLREGLVYVCCEGPRFETKAEISMYKTLGGDVVGMTGVPEVSLAREKGLRYASVVVATNFAAGIQSAVTHEEVLEVMASSGKAVKRLVETTIKGLADGGAS
jgi:5'-methylthioinosine phosphorylase